MVMAFTAKHSEYSTTVGLMEFLDVSVATLVLTLLL